MAASKEAFLGATESGANTSGVSAAARHGDYLLLSDVHLGSDLVQRVRPWALEQWLTETPDIDAPLRALLDHYRTRPSGRPLTLVLAGDFLDLVGVCIGSDGAPLKTPLNREEEAHGLGSAADHVVRKLEAIAARHHEVFRALARFLEAGNRLVVVRGNHDIELHWHAARATFVRAVLQHASEALRPQLAARIQICPWFFHVPGLLYVEHGHEFDATCSYGDPLMPTCPRDPRRIRASAFSVLLRQVARPTRGLSSVSYGYVGMGAYVGLLYKLGLRGSVGIAERYWRASLRLLREGIPVTDVGKRRLRRAEAALRRFARTHGISAERLNDLRALYARPTTHSPLEVARLLYLDRMLAGAAALACVTAAGASAGPVAAVYGTSAALLSAYAAIGLHSNQAPHESLKQGAHQIARMFDARWVVMGHTHAPVNEALDQGKTYVNLGSWGEDDPPDERATTHTALRSFLLLEQSDGEPRASFLRWTDRDVPVPVVMEVAAPLAVHAPAAVTTRLAQGVGASLAAWVGRVRLALAMAEGAGG
jgi:UDP-2,3-diacylglucosamine pyrophosphatase LpxH